MLFFRSERGIGRGEVAESQIEAPIFALFMLVSSALLFTQHLYFGNMPVTIALTISLIVFGVTVVRVDFGLYILTICMLLSPEIDAGEAGTDVRLNLRYDDILIIVIFLGVMVKIGFEGRFRLWRPSRINHGIIGYYSLCLFSSLLALERSLPAWDKRIAFFVLLKMLQYYMVFWLTGHVIRSLKDVRQLLVLFYVVCLVVAGYGIYSIGATPRVSAPFEQGGTEPNTLGGYFVVCICVALGLFLKAPRAGMVRLMLAGVMLTCMLPLLYTLSRASYMALIVGVLVLGFTARRWWVVAAVAAVLAASPFFAPDAVKERVAYTFDPGHTQQLNIAGTELPVKVDKSTQERIYVWTKVRFLMTLAPIYTLFGGGVAWGSILDSQYARVLMETGVLGCMAFVFLQYTFLRTTREAYRWSTDWVGQGLCMGLFATVLALNVHSIGTNSFLIVRIMQPFWLLMALAVFVREQALEAYWQQKLAEAHRRAHPEEVDNPPAPHRPVIRPAVSGRRGVFSS